MDAALAFIYMEWPDELHHRLEAVGLGIGGFQHLVSSRAEDGGIASGGGTQDLVVQVPRGDAQGFAGIELLPRVGCAEVGEVQQTFVHDGEGVGHRLACLFAHGDGEVGLRAQGVGHFYPWLEHSGGVGHRYRRHAIHSDGQVVDRLGVGLQQGDVQIDVGRHVRRDVEGVAGVFFRFHFYPFALQHGGAVLDGYQRMPSGSSGDEGCGFVARLVRFFVQGEGQHLHIVGVGLGGASAPLRPVNVDGAARGVPAFLVLDVDQVASPVGIVHAEGEAGFSVLCFQISAGHGRDGAVVDVCAEGFFPVLPPPAPVYLIYLIL